MTQLDLFSARVVELPADHAVVYRIIERCRGRKCGVLQAVLAERTGFNSRTVRQIVKELIEDHGLAIGSGPSGFFIPVTDEEVKYIRRDLLSRAYSILKRVSALDRNTDLHGILGQLQLKQQEVSHA